MRHRSIRAGAAAAALAICATAGTASADPWLNLYFGTQFSAGQDAVDWDHAYDGSNYAVLGDLNFAAGGFAGFNVPLGPVALFGMELSGEFSDAAIYAPQPSIPEEAMSMIGTVALAARAGVRLDPWTLLYMRGGWAGMHYDLPASYWAGESGDVWLNGYQVGFGMESMLPNHFLLRTQVDYTRAAQSLYVGESELKPAILEARVGIGYAFGPEDPAPQGEMIPGLWDGFYVGAHGGGSGGGTAYGSFDVPEDGPFSDIQPSFGGWVGYDRQVAPRWVLGIEADATRLNLATSYYDDVVDFAKIDWMAALTARFGAIVTPRTLVYLKGGWARMHTEATSDFFSDDAVSGDLNAVQLGVGIEARIRDHLSLRVEGLVTQAVDELSIPLNGIPDINYVKPQVVSGRIGISWRL
jgi:opacity protein-like surface antigen